MHGLSYSDKDEMALILTRSRRMYNKMSLKIINLSNIKNKAF